MKKIYVKICIYQALFFISIHPVGNQLHPFATHIGPLFRAAIASTGPILELGTGNSSTTMLHAIAISQNRTLVSVDNNLDWLNLFLDYNRGLHSFMYVPPPFNSWGNIGIHNLWGLVFIDHAPGEDRKKAISRLRNNADILVIHDTEFHGYEYKSIATTFKYHTNITHITPETGVLSDSIDVTQLFPPQISTPVFRKPDFFSEQTRYSSRKKRPKKIPPTNAQTITRYTAPTISSEGLNYCSHIDPIVRAGLKTHGPILEIGCGNVSTSILGAISDQYHRPLVSLDPCIAWLQFFSPYTTPLHTFVHYQSPEDLDKILKKQKWELICIDHRPDISPKIGSLLTYEVLEKQTDIVLLHCPSETYSTIYESLSKKFTFVYCYNRYSPHTYIMSNVIDIREWFKDLAYAP